VLDLSEVGQVDDAAVRVLAGQAREGCNILERPRWLELWLEHVRGGDGHSICPVRVNPKESDPEQRRTSEAEGLREVAVPQQCR